MLRLSMNRAPWLGLGIVLCGVVLSDFMTATTFIGDDHLFRAFARLEANPLLAFVTDKHGGEYYRPLPMCMWWLLERIGSGKEWPFALAAFATHLSCACLVGVLARKLAFGARSAVLAAILFFVSPAQREAALWFSASTDLLATAAVLATLAAFLTGTRRGRALSVALAALAFLCKETTLVLPGMLFLAAWLGTADLHPRWRRGWARVWPHVSVACVYLAIRFAVLRGLGGANDPPAPWWGRAVQMVSGLVHAVTGNPPGPDWIPWLLGLALLAWAARATLHMSVGKLLALLTLLTLLPLPAAGWVVGTRYFYLPAAGLLLLIALAFENKGRLMPTLLVVAMLLIGGIAGRTRAREIQLYRGALLAARQAVEQGSVAGQRVFLIRGAMKDVDLAIKLAGEPSPASRASLSIPDVPASFVWLPEDLAARADFLLARPALPPSGAYRFGGASIVGLARREDAPDLDEVLERFPDLRIIQLRALPDGSGFTWRDNTDLYTRVLR